MAAAGQAFRLCARSCRRLPSAPRIAPRATTQFSQQRHQQRRAFAVSSTRRAKDDEVDPDEDTENLYSRETPEEVVARLKPEEIKALEGLRKLDPSAQDMKLEEYLKREVTADEDGEDKPLWDSREWKEVSKPARGSRSAFWYDEDEPLAPSEKVMDEFDEDDITSMAHGKLDEIREHRHYHRIMAWEMPLLSKLAKPFEPPAEDEILRFRYTTYMGEYHPAEKKVVVQFSPADLKLTPVQTNKLKKLAGPRYNPETDIIKMSCEKFDHQAQNKRYLSDMVDKLIENAKDSKDTFEDIPLDTRHHKFKVKPKFPKEWRMTEERRKELEEHRLQQIQAEVARKEAGRIVDGVEKFDQFISPPPPVDETGEPVAEAVPVRHNKKKVPHTLRVPKAPF